ncbi:hypothetical protein H6CHR_01451 [Variovorax sp. PBL-H6]|nr:hypothetical protein H6CHR_01451 [Variovorax sp. PBL-H6]
MDVSAARNAAEFSPLGNYKKRVQSANLGSLEEKAKVLEEALESSKAEHAQLPPTASKLEQLKALVRVEIVLAQLLFVHDRVKILAEDPQQNGANLKWALNFLGRHGETDAGLLQYIRQDRAKQPIAQVNRISPAATPVSTDKRNAPPLHIKPEPSSSGISAIPLRPARGDGQITPVQEHLHPPVDQQSSTQTLDGVITRLKSGRDAAAQKRLDNFRKWHVELDNPQSVLSPALRKLLYWGAAYRLEVNDDESFSELDKLYNIYAEPEYHAQKALGAVVNEFLDTGSWDKQRIESNVASASLVDQTIGGGWNSLEREILAYQRGEPALPLN